MLRFVRCLAPFPGFFTDSVTFTVGAPDLNEIIGIRLVVDANIPNTL